MTTAVHAGEWSDDGDFVYSLHTATNHSRASFSEEEESSLWEEEENSSEYETDYETDSEDDAPASPAKMKSEVSSRPNNKTSTVASADRARLSRSALIARALERAKKKKKADEENDEGLVYSLHTASTHSIRSSFSEDGGSGDSSEYETDYSIEETDSEYEADSSDGEIDSDDEEEEKEKEEEEKEEGEANPPSMTELVAKALAEAKWKIKADEEDNDDNDFLYSLRTTSNHSVSSLSDEEYEEPLSWEGEKELYCWEEDSNENESSEEKAALAEAKQKMEAEEDDINYDDFVYSLHTASNHSMASSSDEESWEGRGEISPEHDADSDEEADSLEVKEASLDDSGVEPKSENNSSEQKMAPAFDHSAVNGKTEVGEEQNAVEVPIVVGTHAKEASDAPSADDVAIAALPDTAGTVGVVAVSASTASTGTDAEFEALRRELSLLRHGTGAAEEGLEHAALEAELSLSDIGEDIGENEEGSSVSDLVTSDHGSDVDDKDANTNTFEKDTDAAEAGQLSSQEELDSGAASGDGASLILPRDLSDEYDKEMKVSMKTTSITSAREDNIPEGDGRDNGADIIIRQLRRERDELRARAERLESELLASEERADSLERERDEMGAAVETMLQRRREDDRTTEALKEKVRELEAALEKKDDGEDSKAGQNRLVVEPVVAEDTKASRAA